MLKKHSTAMVIENTPMAKNIYRMTLGVEPNTLEYYRPGQFAHFKIPGSGEHLLRRPISINDYDMEKNRIQIAYLLMGEGTKRLAAAREGDALDILFPLGNGFKLAPEQKNVLLIGGGIGIAPLLTVMRYYPDREYRALLGYRSKDYIYQVEEFQKTAKVSVTTDDGSFEKKGYATDLLEAEFEKNCPDVMLACGPTCFFGTLKSIMQKYCVPTFVSLEQHMGCGTGGCSVCVCKIAGENKRVCVEGPVFELAEVEI